jgi:hypothetical protein
MSMTDRDIFKRVATAYNLPRMQRSRMIVFGVGGARSHVEDMARAGVGEFILIDHDVVEEPNIATQQVFLGEIGKAKVEALADCIIQINPAARVEIYQKSLDELSDNQIGALARRPFSIDTPGDEYTYPSPEITLLCGFTDSFYAQARVNRLALQFGLPSLAAALYQYGQAGEITFTYPGVTPACQRCILSPVYKAYLEGGFKPTGSTPSAGAPIFATQHVNALKGMIALTLLHHGTDHLVWGQMLSRIGNRTLVQIRMHPDAPYKDFKRVLAGADTSRLFFGEAIWLPQKADPRCPECKGTGNLLDARGTFTDTRIMPGVAVETEKELPPFVF